jgi:inosine-uridine nucleoside N-ribohydrolase
VTVNQQQTGPVNIILDSDFANNTDDVGDHALLWALAKRGEANVLALITSSSNDFSAPAVRAVAKYYGHQNVPVGAYHGNTPNDYSATNSYYAQQIASQFGTPGETRANYPDAVTVYRQALAAAPDHSVVIVAGGYYEPLSALLQSGPDVISPLSGTQLVAQKVWQFVPAAGWFPDSGSSASSNFGWDPNAASYVFANWPTPIVSVGTEVGADVITGPAANADPNTNPIKLAYNLYCGDGAWCPNAVPAWTQVALLYAIRGGVGTMFSMPGENGHTVVWNSSQATPGRNIWSPTPTTGHSYIEKIIPAANMQNIINPLIQAAP